MRLCVCVCVVCGGRGEEGAGPEEGGVVYKERQLDLRERNFHLRPKRALPEAVSERRDVRSARRCARWISASSKASSSNVCRSSRASSTKPDSCRLMGCSCSHSITRAVTGN